jgi:hypothetical protein
MTASVIAARGAAGISVIIGIFGLRSFSVVAPAIERSIRIAHTKMDFIATQARRGCQELSPQIQQF